MENSPEENNELSGENISAEQPTIFSDLAVDTSALEKSMKAARVWLYIIGGFQIIIGVFEYLKYTDYADTIRWLIFGIDVFIGIVFLALAILSYKKPVVAFVTSLIFYVVVNIFMIYYSGFSSLTYYYFVKILVIIALIKAIKDAREYAAVKNGLGNN